MNKLTLNLCVNGDLKTQKPIVLLLPLDFMEILSCGKNKFRINPSRIFDRFGVEITKENLSLLHSGSLIVFSKKGEDFKQQHSMETTSDNVNKEVIGEFQQVLEDQRHPMVSIIASKSFIDDEAIKQLKNVSLLPNVIRVIGMPDLHPGKGYPIGSCVVTNGVIYPHLIGTDIGCGMLLVRTDIQLEKNVTKRKIEKWIKNISLDHQWEGDFKKWLTDRNITEDMSFYDFALGTIGGGNHFAELQEIREICCDENKAKEFGLDPAKLFLLIHSGSRSFGESVLIHHENLYGTKGLSESSSEAKEYLIKHDLACNWARANRELICHRFLQSIQAVSEKTVADIFHNNVESRTDPMNSQATKSDEDLSLLQIKNSNSENVLSDSADKMKTKNNNSEGSTKWIHRKGCAPTDKGLVVIPGSRGSFSYIVSANDSTEEGRRALEKCCFSIAHGGGRKWKRSKAFAMTSEDKRQNMHTLSTTELGSRVICSNKQLMYEEVPEAYKQISDVIDDLVLEKLIEVVAILQPILTYKTKNF